MTEVVRQVGEQRSNPRRLRTLGNVLINLGYASTDELFVIRERLQLAQGNLDNDTAIVDAAIEDRFASPPPEDAPGLFGVEDLTLPDTEELELPEDHWKQEAA